MRTPTSLQILAKDLRLGPRSPLLLWALVLPVLMTLLIRGVFGGLFDRDPSLGIVDLGASVLTTQAAALDGIEVVSLDDAEELRRQVEAHDLDAGLVLPPGFDADVRSGRQPPLQLVVAGDSLASDRIVVAVTSLDLVRGLTGTPAPVEVDVVALGDPGVPFDLRLLPLIVIMAVAIAGGMIPAASLVEERERGTLSAVLVTPASIGDVLLAKALLGWLLAVVAGVATLGLNGVLGVAPEVTLPAIALGAAMMAPIGLLLGCWAPDTNTLFAAWKLGGMLLVLPVIVVLWPEVPSWVGRIGPTSWFVVPVWEASVDGAGLRETWRDLAVAAAIVIALVPVAVAGGRRLERRLGAATARGVTG